MNDNLEKIKIMCKSANISGNLSDEFLFTINCVDYFYYLKNIGVVDIRDGFTDGANDGGIDFIYSDESKMYLIQGKSSSSVSIDEISDLFHKINDSYIKLQDRKFDAFSNKLSEKYMNIHDSFNNEPDVEMVLFTNTRINDDLSKKIEELKKLDAFQNYTISVYGKDEIEDQVYIVNGKERSVPNGELKLDSAKNQLSYDDGKGLIVTIKASSLKELYKKYSQNGLFGYNLREHITEKKVDGAIDDTINNNKNAFWFFNNGITIGCSDYVIDGYMLRLNNFSIINGAQTTTKIGTSPKVSPEYDFSLVCKVIKSENSLNDDFIRQISRASNSQKPIKPRDLRANSKEQTRLQQMAESNGNYSLSIEIKRGVQPPRKPKNSWEKVNNEFIGQLILACDFQQPGTARSCKADIFGKEATYNSIFSYKMIKSYDYNSLYDLVRLAHIYDEFKLEYTKENERISLSENDARKVALANENAVCVNGKFVILSLICYLYKKYIMKIDSLESMKKTRITGNLTLDYREDDYDEKLKYLFKYFVKNLSSIYDKYQATKNLTSHSNFFKTDLNYYQIIIPEIEIALSDEFMNKGVMNSLTIFKK